MIILLALIFPLLLDIIVGLFTFITFGISTNF